MAEIKSISYNKDGSIKTFSTGRGPNYNREDEKKLINSKFDLVIKSIDSDIDRFKLEHYMFVYGENPRIVEIILAKDAVEGIENKVSKYSIKYSIRDDKYSILVEIGLDQGLESTNSRDSSTVDFKILNSWSNRRLIEKRVRGIKKHVKKVLSK